ncbi:DUF2491 family protein [Massilia sp. TS11]|uniref:DUF2491 family protein n=1 Tax=Massilia sp. TS11 TaxID=2908003 RepID=UPI001EDAEC73|nr:DUF2491 family protein [Massilia sp. TS11]MCG2585196.1 YjfK family protein [Massilia sp. TS11]
MAWKDAFDYLRGTAGKAFGKPEDAPQDRGLPLGARIGSLVHLQQSPLLRASAGGSLLALPDEHATRILAISQLKLNMDGKLYRYYLDTGDADGDETFLQLYVNARGELAELLFCSQLTRLVPETVEEQEMFTGAAGSGLGDASYTLWRWQLEEFGLDLDAIFGSADEIVYQREAGHPDTPWIAPFRGSETRIDDAGGHSGLKQEVYLMPYTRPLADGLRESLLISTEILASVNGDSRQRGIHVDFVIGIPVEQARLQIQ